MPERYIVTRELSRLFRVLSHPHRIQIVEELRSGELDVNALEKALGVSHSRVSQHLADLRAHRLVTMRREGRHVFYRLTQPAISGWLLQGLRFIEQGLAKSMELRSAVEHVRHLWAEEPSETDKDTEAETKNK